MPQMLFYKGFGAFLKDYLRKWGSFKHVRQQARAASRVSKGISPPAPHGTVREPLDSYGSSRCLDQSVNLRLLIVWINRLIIPFGCFVFTNFYILCTPSLLLTFISYQHYYGYIRPCTGL